jgi:hypothetical protein
VLNKFGLQHPIARADELIVGDIIDPDGRYGRPSKVATRPEPSERRRVEWRDDRGVLHRARADAMFTVKTVDGREKW